jgi:nicotinate-nucleotide adenylyltransferase
MLSRKRQNTAGRTMSTAKRIGFFGGTFDPVHMGHLIVAEQCREQGRLDEVWFVPANQPPHKLDKEVTPFDRRVEMVELAIAGHPAFRVDTMERDRPGPSFTSDSLVELHRRHPEVDFYLLIGSDSLAELPSWREPRRVVESAGLLVMLRGSHPVKSAAEMRAALDLPPEVPLRLEAVEEPPIIHISSRSLRQRVALGRSIRYLVPRAVECYIRDKELYR